MNSQKNNIKTIIILLESIVLIAISVFFLQDSFLLKNQAESQFTAVFMENGQVYFGNIQKESSSEILLENIYYLQFSEATQAAEIESSDNSFNLIKRGKELHMPTDSMEINKEYVLFTEVLSQDSEIVKTIQNSN